MNTYIIDAIRTPIGNFCGTLKDIRTDDLAAHAIKSLVGIIFFLYISIV